MIGLDTNVLVRFVTKDDPVQSPAAAEFLDSLTVDNPGYVPVITAVELMWVLRRGYRLSAADAAQVVRRLMGAQELVFEAADQLVAALKDSDRLGCDPADSLIASRANRAGCSATVTFDRRAAAIPTTRLL
jgi:predicted nucleic-acid-binding protein